MPFSRMIACARAMRCNRSSTPIGGTSPRMFFIAASSASAVDPPTPTVIASPFLLLFVMRRIPALHQDIRRRRQPQRRGHQDEGHGRAERPVVELELAVDQRPHHPEFAGRRAAPASHRHSCRG